MVHFLYFSVDIVPPKVTNCPPDIHMSVELGTSLSPVYWPEPFATDNSSQVFVFYRSHVSGQKFPVNVTEVSYGFVDEASNKAFCNFSVTLDEG